MNDHNIRRRDTIRQLASIPQKDGAVIVGVRHDGTEATLTVYVDPADGLHKVAGYAELAGWKIP